MPEYPCAELEVSFLSEAEGGRKALPRLDDKNYRAHLRVAGDREYLGVRFIAGPDVPLKAGVFVPATVQLIYYPMVSYRKLTVGVEFEIMEGTKVVGKGKVIRR